MHDKTDMTHWHEPKAGENAGFGKFGRPAMPYDRFMEEEGIPIYRGIGVRRVRDLPLKPWKRLGGNGTFIQLYGTEGLWGMHVVEIPGAGALNVEKHMYEKVVLILEGRGTTEVWQEGQAKRHTFEWAKGSMFTIPLNASHRFINASSQPALMLCGTSAPNVMNLLDNMDFIFNCPYHFTDRFSGAEDFFKPKDDIEPDPIRGLAMRKTNLIPDVINAELPLDNRRSPGYRRMEPQMANNRFYTWIGEHETGRYSKAHKHASAAVLICLKGKGYTYTWPEGARHAAVGNRPRRQGDAAGLRAGRHGVGGADERRLVPPAFRHRYRPAARHRLARAEQPARAQGRRPGRGADGLRRDRSEERRRRHPLSRGGSRAAQGIRRDAEERRRQKPDGRALVYGQLGRPAGRCDVS